MAGTPDMKDGNPNPLSVSIALPDGLVEAIGDHVLKRLLPILEGIDKQTDEILDVRGLAAYLKVSEDWIYDQRRQYGIPFIMVGGKLRFRKAEIDRWIEKQTVSPLPKVRKKAGRQSD